jgi:archaellum component FlaG (FlaF/FlaG flagellin family)
LRAKLVVILIVSAATAAWAAGSLAAAATYLKEGEKEKAAAELMAYGRDDPAAPLANQALDCVLLLYKKNVGAEALAEYVDALALVADGYAGTADIVFREMAADEGIPWPVRGRAALLAADINAAGDRVELLESAWRDCDDETGRLLGVALAEAYYKDDRAEDARKVRDEFAERFPGDAGFKYFDYLSEEYE